MAGESDFILTPCSFNPATSTFYEGIKDENNLLSFYPKANNEGILCTSIEFKSPLDGEVIIMPEFLAEFPGIKFALDFHNGQPIEVFSNTEH